jgi:hypothetical protein
VDSVIAACVRGARSTVESGGRAADLKSLFLLLHHHHLYHGTPGKAPAGKRASCILCNDGAHLRHHSITLSFLITILAPNQRPARKAGPRPNHFHCQIQQKEQARCRVHSAEGPLTLLDDNHSIVGLQCHAFRRSIRLHVTLCRAYRYSPLVCSVRNSDGDSAPRAGACLTYCTRSQV